MNEGRARDLPDNRSFEERVFARFDAIDVRFDGVDVRFDSVNAQLDGLDIRVQALEARALDTKPIWERALTEILEVKKGVERPQPKDRRSEPGCLQVRADQRRVEKRMDTLESGLQ